MSFASMVTSRPSKDCKQLFFDHIHLSWGFNLISQVHLCDSGLHLYCQSPNSTNSSIQQSLRLDYILTSDPRPTTTQTLCVVVVINCPASRQAACVYNCTVTHRPVYPLCTMFSRPNFNFFQIKGL